MPLRVEDLHPGDRVLLNCPKSRVQTKREAVFEGTYDSFEQAAMTGHAFTVWDAREHVPGRRWARFLLQTVEADVVHCGGAEFRTAAGVADLMIALAIEPDGSMRDDDGRGVFIERRMVAGKG